ncbi:hypothetical protein HYX13_04335 [Candidatus Woesearchaeota archaeon]|nr:hypothetical protein [Candidatus Woesearchaeota archaeon]
MNTTIQVSAGTRQLLEHLKREEKAPSYDAVIQHLVFKKKKVAGSFFGTVKGLTWKKKEDRLQLHEL